MPILYSKSSLLIAPDLRLSQLLHTFIEPYDMTMIRQLPRANFSHEKLRVFLIDHLNVIYCVKSHLIERLPDIAEHANFTDLRHAIIETLDDVQKQLLRMDEIFETFETKHSPDHCNDNYQLIEMAFTAIHAQSEDYGMRDLSILFYLLNIESIEMSSFNVLLIAAKKYNNKHVIQLLKENADEARADVALFILLTARYLQ